MRAPKESQVFISYSQPDLLAARKVASKLTELGVKVWLDHDSLSPGASWQTGIKDAIEASDFLILLVSKSSLASPWVAHEMGLALGRELEDRGITILPLIIDDVSSNALPDYLSRMIVFHVRNAVDYAISRLSTIISSLIQLDLNSLGPQGFETLIGSLLVAMEFSVEATSRFKDTGYDFVAERERIGSFGTAKKEVWLVEVKYDSAERLNPAKLAQMLERMSTHKTDAKLVIMTNARLTSALREVAEDLQQKLAIDFLIFDSAEIKRLLLYCSINNEWLLEPR